MGERKRRERKKEGREEERTRQRRKQACGSKRAGLEITCFVDSPNYRSSTKKTKKNKTLLDLG